MLLLQEASIAQQLFQDRRSGRYWSLRHECGKLQQGMKDLPELLRKQADSYQEALDCVSDVKAVPSLADRFPGKVHLLTGLLGADGGAVVDWQSWCKSPNVLQE